MRWRQETLIITDVSLLKEKCVDASADEIKDIISLLDNELNIANKFQFCGIGLSASQIGINKKVAIIRLDKFKINLVNCSIAEKFDLKQSKEGCLSLPGKSYILDRYNEIIIKDNFLGNINNFVCYGMVAIVVQHELDHALGLLISDKENLKDIHIGDNMPCPCGSKIKFKKCCKNRVTN